ncbi:MAG TPA: hypothetical protein VFD82_18935 [Planctomycetota bacterium]|nr:hypothetical protein [Planctomycetota bacterium]
MHYRQSGQSGATTVPMAFFLILLLLFLGALGFAYSTVTKNGELTKERDTLRDDAKTMRNKMQLVDHYIEDLGKVVGKLSKYPGRQGVDYGTATLDSPSVMNPAEIRKLMDDSCTAAGVSIASSLENVFGAMIASVNFSTQRVTEMEAERAKALTEKSAVDAEFQKATTEASTKAAEWARNLDQARSDFNAQLQSKDTNNASLTESVKAKNDELTTAREEAAKREKDMRNEISKRDIRLSAMTERDRMRNLPDVADGKIIVARNGVSMGFINLGRKDLLQPGTMFHVKNPNNPAVKGYAEVTRVEEDRAEVALSNFVDPVGDFAREGDLIYNPIFTPRMTRTIYLMGRFTAPYNKEQLTLLLKRLGNRVVAKMAPGVDTVVLGNDPVNEAGDGFTVVKDSEEYKEAHRLNVEFTYLNIIRDLIKL